MDLNVGGKSRSEFKYGTEMGSSLLLTLSCPVSHPIHTFLEVSIRQCLLFFILATFPAFLPPVGLSLNPEGKEIYSYASGSNKLEEIIGPNAKSFVDDVQRSTKPRSRSILMFTTTRISSLKF